MLTKCVLYYITGVGESFGEIALVHRDSFRNATIIADDDADLMVAAKYSIDTLTKCVLYYITGVGESFGEIALVHRDSFRNATIIADDDADLMVIDQELFDRSLRVGDNNRR